jgi:serine/threonine protein kinase
MSNFGGSSNSQRYRAQEVLGQGTYGKVYKALDTVTNRMIAMKKALMDLETEGVPTTVMREVATLKDLSNYPHIVALLDVVVTEQKIFLIFEFMDQDLRKVIDSRPLELTEIKRIFLQIIEALNYCHSRRIMHRDLKPENVLLDLAFNTKLADFGLARVFQIPVRPYTQCVQTLWYRAPEILLGCDEYSVAVDMWSAGCILVELFTREPIFRGDNELSQLYRIFAVTGTPTERDWPGVTQLRNYSASFPAISPSGLDLKVPQADATALDLMQQLLTLDPTQRISAKQARTHPFFN